MKRLAWKLGLTTAVVLAAAVGSAQAEMITSYTASVYDPASGITFPSQTAGYALTIVDRPRTRYPSTSLSQNGGTAFDIGPSLGYDYANTHEVIGQAVNNLGVVAGLDINQSAPNTTSLFVRTPNSPSDLSTGTFQDLLVLKTDTGPYPQFFDLTAITAINDQDFILGRGTDIATGRAIDVLFTPTFATAAAPEPGTLGAALTGAVLCGFYLRRKARGGPARTITPA